VNALFTLCPVTELGLLEGSTVRTSGETNSIDAGVLCVVESLALYVYVAATDAVIVKVVVPLSEPIVLYEGLPVNPDEVSR
jgi:hypothetical protein